VVKTAPTLPAGARARRNPTCSKDPQIEKRGWAELRLGDDDR